MPDRRRAWAAALFAAAPDEERRTAYCEALEGIAREMAGPRGGALRDFLRDPDVAADEKAEALASAGPGAGRRPAGGEGADPVFRRFCGLLIEKGRASLVPAIAAAYRLALDRAAGVSPLEIEAAREVPEPVLRRLSEAWRKASGAAAVRATARVNPGLVAGYRLRSGSVLMDYSVAGRAARLGRELAKPLGPRQDAPAADGALRGEG